MIRLDTIYVKFEDQGRHRSKIKVTEVKQELTYFSNCWDGRL